MSDINSVPLIVRREIEALVAAPLITAFSEECGREKAMEIAASVTRSLAEESGRLLKTAIGGNSMEHLQKVLDLFSQGGALEFETLETTPTSTIIDVTRCKYAEMYRKLGLEEFGYVLSCGRDSALMEGFNPNIKFERAQTMMEGAKYCDFRYTLIEG